MSILPQLENNKGTISSALGKSLAKKVLAGDASILEEAVVLLAHDSKNVRAGAAKIIEQVALADPSLVVGSLPRLVPALDVPEPQTRWMIIHALGICAALDTQTALHALPKAQEFIRADSGACLWGSTVLYLGYVGATSETNARTVFPILERVLRDIPKQTKRVLESFMSMLDQADGDIQILIARHAETYAQDEKAGIRTAARKIQKRIDKQ
ncbi:MAG: hypothetical protein GY832_18035 [Chloroflexi bacterium]|nr:hypothetical protein [Chloroflexota bacterium]